MDSSTVAVTLLLIMSSTVIMTVKSQGASTCTVEQKTPEQAVLTCDFKTDVQLQTSIAVKFTPNNSQEVQIATCSKTIKQPELQCKREDVGYQIQVSRPQGSFLNITIPTSMEGTFTCMLLPATPQNSGTCTFKKSVVINVDTGTATQATEKNDAQSHPESEDSSPIHAGVITMIVVLVGVLVALAIFIILWRTGKLNVCCQRLPCLHCASKTDTTTGSKDKTKEATQEELEQFTRDENETQPVERDTTTAPGDIPTDATQEQSEPRTTNDTTDGRNQGVSRVSNIGSRNQALLPDAGSIAKFQEEGLKSRNVNIASDNGPALRETIKTLVRDTVEEIINSKQNLQLMTDPLPTKKDKPKVEGVESRSLGYDSEHLKGSFISHGNTKLQFDGSYDEVNMTTPDGTQFNLKKTGAQASGQTRPASMTTFSDGQQRSPRAKKKLEMSDIAVSKIYKN